MSSEASSDQSLHQLLYDFGVIMRQVVELETLVEAQRVVAVEKVEETWIRESEYERLFLESLPGAQREEETRRRNEDIQRIRRMGRDFEHAIEINDDDDM
ncbi:2177_t:CDS:2, partial [Racocetra fulgida]